MGKPTYTMIAKAAGVGTATVERVLNGRGGVRPPTVKKVILAARALDWPGRLPEQHRGIMRIEVILMRPTTSFFERLANAFRRIAASLDPSVQVHVTFLDGNDPAGLARHIAKPSHPRAGLVISGPDQPAVQKAVGQVHASGVPVVQVVSQTVPGPTYVGIDNYAAGRMAALMVAKLEPRRGPVVVLCKGGSFSDSRDRVRGFADYLEENPSSGKKLVYVADTRDNREEANRALIEAVQHWPRTVAIYNASGGNSGAFKALEKLENRVFFAGHELNDLSIAALRNGHVDVIFDQLPESQARRAVDVLLSQIGLINVEVENPPIRFTTITPQNI